MTLQQGTHASRGLGLNAMEATAWLANTDAPVSVAPSFRWLILMLNDHAPDAPRQRLKEVLAYLIGTATYGDEARRIEAIVHWARQNGLPLESGPAGLREAANQLQEAAGSTHLGSEATQICPRQLGREPC